MRRLLRAVAVMGMSLGVGGCFAWQTVGALPRTTDLPADTRLTKYDGTIVVLSSSRIENDTIKGYIMGSNVRQIIPLAHVDLIEAKRLQVKESVIGGTLTAVAIYAIFSAIKSARPFGPIAGPPAIVAPR